MADITVVAAKVADAMPKNSEVFEGIALEAITAGQVVYRATTGKYGVADANGAGFQQARGIALTPAAAGGAFSFIKKGFVTGFAVSGLNADVPVYLSDTAGALGDGAGTMTVVCGRVVCLNDSPTFTKLVYVDFDWLRAWT